MSHLPSVSDASKPTRRALLAAAGAAAAAPSSAVASSEAFLEPNTRRGPWEDLNPETAIFAVTSVDATDHKSCAAVGPINYVGTKSLRATVVMGCMNDT